MNGSTSFSATPATAPGPDSGAPGTGGDGRPVRFTLSGPSRPYDPVHQAIRPDLADVAEASHHFAPHYAEALMCAATEPARGHESPGDDAATRFDLAPGAGFALLDLSGGWAWGYATDGHIVGYVRRERLRIAG